MAAACANFWMFDEHVEQGEAALVEETAFDGCLLGVSETMGRSERSDLSRSRRSFSAPSRRRCEYIDGSVAGY